MVLNEAEDNANLYISINVLTGEITINEIVSPPFNVLAACRIMYLVFIVGFLLLDLLERSLNIFDSLLFACIQFSSRNTT